MTMLYLIGNWGEIWTLSKSLKSKAPWVALTQAALRNMDVAFAKRVYRAVLSDPAMVQNLDRIEIVQDRVELTGHLAVLLGEFDLANVHTLFRLTIAMLLRLKSA